MDTRPIGVFDSGAGGLTVLKRAATALPREDFVYFGDSANAPYGTLPPEKILELSLRAADFLLGFGIKMLVIACNTATSAAAPALRARLDIPVVAMEPALKPAQLLRRDGQIIVLATRATLSMPRFSAHMREYGEGAVAAPVFGLVELIEHGITSGAHVERCLWRALERPLQTPTDAIVLGCTHYPFVAQSVRALARGVPVTDGGAGTVRQIARLLGAENPCGGAVKIYSSGGESRAAVMHELFKRYTPED